MDELTGLRVGACTQASMISAGDWEALGARPPASINGSRVWVTAALATSDRGRKPHLLTVHSAGRLVGLLALVLDTESPTPTVRLAGTPHNNLTDILILDGYERAAAAAVRELGALSSRGWALDLDLLDPAGALARADTHQRVLRWSPSEPAPTIDLRGAWRSAASPRRRQRWDRAIARLEDRHRVEFARLEGADAVAGLGEFLRLRDIRLRAKRRAPGAMPVGLIEAAVRGLAATGRCAFFELRIDGQVGARDLYLLDPPVALLWLRALDVGWQRFPCGHLLLRATAEGLTASGYETLDLGSGDEPYKFLFGARSRTLLRATLDPGGCRPAGQAVSE